MRIFLYEHLTGGGMLAAGGEAPASLLTEGLAMLRAIGMDLGKVNGVELTILVEERFKIEELPAQRALVSDVAGWQAAFATAVKRSDGVLLIAPETDGVLYHLAHQVEALGGRLLSPSSAFIRLAADKQQTAEQLARWDVPAPRGGLWRTGDALPPTVTFPAMIKPVDGCGSQDVRVLWSPAELPDSSAAWRLETYHSGLAASVALLCGPGGTGLALPACSQRLSSDGRFTYLGGETPLPLEFDARARRLADKALAALARISPPLGYVGVDLVLGDDPAGREDVVIEVNPRLTTSYVGLRAACRGNLGEAMLQISLGEAATVDFGPERIEFEANGVVRDSSVRTHLSGSSS